MAYGDFKDLSSRKASDQLLHDKAFNIAKNPKYDKYQYGLASVVYHFLIQSLLLLVMLLKTKLYQTKN